MGSKRLAVSAVVSCMAVCGSVRSAPANEPVDPAAGNQLPLVYVAPDECPDREAFLREWRALGDSDGFSVPELDAGVVRVTLRRSGEEFIAHMVMVDGAGQCGAQRTLSAPSCAELVPDVAASLALAARDWTCPPPAPPPLPLPPPDANPPRPAPEPRRGELGLTGGLLWFVPDQGKGARGGAVLLGYRSPRSLWGVEAGSVWSAQLEVGYWIPPVLPAEVPGNDLSLELRLPRARLAACPVEFQAFGPLAVPLCATIEAGFLLVDVDGEREAQRFWTAIGIAARLRLASGTLFAEIEPSVAFPLMRYRIQGGREIIAGIAPGAQLRLGVRF